jgi:hypothetical protein
MFTPILRYSLNAMIAVGIAAASYPSLAQTSPAAQGSEQTHPSTSAKAAYANAKPSDSLKHMSGTDKLLAIEEIKQLSLRYGRCISQKDWVCVRDLFAPEFLFVSRTMTPESFIDIQHSAGTYDRVMAVVHVLGEEIEILSPTTARGIVTGDFTFYYPLGQSFPTTGKEAVAPGQQSHTDTYYYETYEKLDGRWKIKTLDHPSFDLRRDQSAYTRIFEGAYTTSEGVPPIKR